MAYDSSEYSRPQSKEVNFELRTVKNILTEVEVRYDYVYQVCDGTFVTINDGEEMWSQTNPRYYLLSEAYHPSITNKIYEYQESPKSSELAYLLFTQEEIIKMIVDKLNLIGDKYE